MKIFAYILPLLAILTPGIMVAQDATIDQMINAVTPADAYIFVRDDCSHCQDLKQFTTDNNITDNGYVINEIDIYTDTGKALFDHATGILKTGKVTPISLVGGQVYVGFSEGVLGKALLDHASQDPRISFAFYSYLDQISDITDSGPGCEEGSLEPCEEPSADMTIPVLGTINPQTVSLYLMAIMLGFVDGFNPCAMWVLLTFLLILSQLGNRKKMIQVAGLFIVAEAVMYYLILNVWYQTWDFIALDGIVTPLVGLLGLGSGSYFIYKYWSSRGKALTCDITSVEHQEKTESRIQSLVSQPMTFVVAIAIIGLALSVNIIEFACSVGIPQAFTKVLELNNLSFMQYQGYTLVYTFFYMVDDFIVFGLAIWGYQKFYAVGQKYSKISTLIAGILMLALGSVLLLNPDILSF